MNSSIIEVKHLVKCFGKHEVIKDISFDVREQEILCLLGPNGAGKSTTIHIITGILNKDGGDILYQGKSIVECMEDFRRCIGFVPQDIALYEDLSAEQNIRFFASLYGLSSDKLEKQVAWGLEFAGLRNRCKDKVKTFSGGMKRRLNIACAIAHEPKLVIMDEPTVGIDPQSRNHILQGIRELQSKGMTILYTTHYMEEVEEISDRIIIMDDGKIIAEGNQEELKENLEDQRQFMIEVEDSDGVCKEGFYHLEGVRDVVVKGNVICITTLKQTENLDRIIGEVLQQNLKIRNLNCQSMNLETVFLRLTGRTLRD